MVRLKRTIFLLFLLTLPLLLTPVSASTFVSWVSQSPLSPISTEMVSVWINSDTVYGETAMLEYVINGNYVKTPAEFNDWTVPGANWVAYIPGGWQPGTTVSYQLFVSNQFEQHYSFTGFNWSYVINTPPVVGNIPGETVAEGTPFATFDLDTYLTDPDVGDTITWLVNDDNLLTVSVGAGNIVTVTPPSVNWNGSETILFTATDSVNQQDWDSATFTVSPVNDPPIVSNIPDKSIAEGASFTPFDLDDHMTDADIVYGDTVSWSASGNVSLGININSQSIVTVTIPPNWNGSETVTFTASDGEAQASDSVTFTVTGVNDPPVVSGIPDQTIDEGETFATIDLDSYVNDPDSTTFTWSVTGTFDLNVNIDANNIATITAPHADWYGEETLTFTVKDNQNAQGSDTATFIVMRINDPPVVSGIPDQTIFEGGTFEIFDLDDYVTDVDSTSFGWTFEGNSDLLVDINGEHEVTITTPDADWYGSETITFVASDAEFSEGSASATFSVVGINDAPVIGDIENQSVAEGNPFAIFDLDAYITDVDGDTITWTAGGAVDLSVNIDDQNVVTVTAPVDWNGQEIITFNAHDGTVQVSDTATFTVTPVNDPPVVSGIPDQTIAEGDTFTTFDLDDFAADVDSPHNFTWTVSGMIDLQVVIDGDSTVTITPPDADWFGSETVTFTVKDTQNAEDSQAVTFTVTAVNDAPEVAGIPDQTIAEGGTFTTFDLDDFATDVDDAGFTWSFSGNGALTVNIDGDNVATISAPANWNGTQSITFTAKDSQNATGFDPADFTVTGVNDAPVVSDIGDQTIVEDGTFNTFDLDTFVTDADIAYGDTIEWSVSGDNHLTVTINPANNAVTVSTPPNWSGSEAITFTATDDALATASDTALFTVTPVNDAPAVSGIPDQTIPEGGTFTTFDLDTFASDIDSTLFTWSFSGNIGLNVSIGADNIVTVSIPNADWNGVETITFTVKDDLNAQGSDSATFTVTGVNDAPVVSDIGDQTIVEGEAFDTFDLDHFVTDADLNYGDSIVWSANTDTPLSVAIDGNNVVTVMADVNWSGVETITFTAKDSANAEASDTATFTVTTVADAPVLEPIGNKSVAQGSELTFTVVASDGDNEILTYSLENTIPTGASINSNTGVFTWTPNSAQVPGDYPMTVRVEDSTAQFDEETFTVTVTSAVNLLQNPGFEIAGSKASLAASWTLKTKPILAKTDRRVCNTIRTTFSHTGNCAMRFQSSVANKAGTRRLFQTVNLNLTGSYTLYFNGWARGVNLSAKPVVQITAFDAANNKQVLNVVIPRGSFSYREIIRQKALTITPTRIKVEVRVVNTSGTLLLDDFALTVVPTGVARSFDEIDLPKMP